MPTLTCRSLILSLLFFAPATLPAHIPNYDSKVGVISIPPPPQFQRPPLSAKILTQGVGLQLYGGRSDRTNTELANEGALQVHLALAPGWDMQTGINGPYVTPFFGLRYQLLGQGWEHGPFVAMEAMGTAVPDLSAGLSVGADLGGFEPYVSARSGRFLAFDYYEGGAGVVMPPLGILRISGGVSSRVSQSQHDEVRVTSAGGSLTFVFGTGPKRLKKRRKRRVVVEEELDEDSAEPAEGAAPASAEPEKASHSLPGEP